MVSTNDNTAFVKLPLTTAVEGTTGSAKTQHSELTCNTCGNGRILFTGPIFSELSLLASSLLDILPIPRFNMSIV